MRFLTVLFALLVTGCGSGVSDDPSEGAGSFDDESPTFQLTLCKVEATCSAKNEAECNRDVGEDMAYAKQLLDDAGEGRCAQCMHVKAREFQKVLDASCDFAAGDEVAIRAACDLDPNDGVDMFDEACAGYP